MISNLSKVKKNRWRIHSLIDPGCARIALAKNTNCLDESIAACTTITHSSLFGRHRRFLGAVEIQVVFECFVLINHDDGGYKDT